MAPGSSSAGRSLGGRLHLHPAHARKRGRTTASSAIEARNITAEGFDVIGDIHGHADHLIGLLAAMGYEQTASGYRHPTRQAVFVGDLVDRGPKQRETINTVRSMVDAGSAQMVLGNHEINTVRYHLRDPRSPDGHVRPHTQKNRAIHSAFLNELVEGSADHREVIDWFLTLPLWLDLGDLRVVHACWHEPSIELLASHVGVEGQVTEELLRSEPDSPQEAALSTISRGPEVPVERPYLFPSGTRSTKARFRWWDRNATTADRAILLPDGARTESGAPYPPLAATPIAAPVEPYESGVPVLFGHYWRRGTPGALTPQAACLDFSVARGGPLVAYRWQGESTLNDDNFVAFNL